MMDTGQELTNNKESKIKNQKGEEKAVARRISKIQKELESNLTDKFIKPADEDSPSASKSRFGRARKQKVDYDFLSIDDAIGGASKSPHLKSPGPLPQCSKDSKALDDLGVNGDLKTAKKKDNSVDPVIESIVIKNHVLSRFSDPEKSRKSSKKEDNKVYIKKDLIQRSSTDNVYKRTSAVRNPFRSPTKSHFVQNIIEKSSEIKKVEPVKNKSHKPDRKSIVKTLDFEDGKNSKDTSVPNLSDSTSAEVKPQKYNIEELEKNCAYKVGDIAWARVGFYPFWPCFVTRDPDKGIFVKKKVLGRATNTPDVIHVTYFGDSGRRGWIFETMLRRYVGVEEFYKTRDSFSNEEKKKDSKLFAAFIISEKQQKKWNIAVEEADLFLKKPREERVEYFYELFVKPYLKTQPSDSAKKKKDNTNMTLSESLLEGLFSDDVENKNTKSKKMSRHNSLDVSDIVTACLDDMATKTGYSKIQKQSHMDIWLQKAKSKTPEKNLAGIAVSVLAGATKKINENINVLQKSKSADLIHLPVVKETNDEPLKSPKKSPKKTPQKKSESSHSLKTPLKTSVTKINATNCLSAGESDIDFEDIIDGNIIETVEINDNLLSSTPNGKTKEIDLNFEKNTTSEQPDVSLSSDKRQIKERHCKSKETFLSSFVDSLNRSSKNKINSSEKQPKACDKKNNSRDNLKNFGDNQKDLCSRTRNRRERKEFSGGKEKKSCDVLNYSCDKQENRSKELKKLEDIPLPSDTHTQSVSKNEINLENNTDVTSHCKNETPQENLTCADDTRKQENVIHRPSPENMEYIKFKDTEVTLETVIDLTDNSDNLLVELVNVSFRDKKSRSSEVQDVNDSNNTIKNESLTVRPDISIKSVETINQSLLSKVMTSEAQNESNDSTIKANSTKVINEIQTSNPQMNHCDSKNKSVSRVLRSRRNNASNTSATLQNDDFNKKNKLMIENKSNTDTEAATEREKSVSQNVDSLLNGCLEANAALQPIKLPSKDKDSLYENETEEFLEVKATSADQPVTRNLIFKVDVHKNSMCIEGLSLESLKVKTTVNNIHQQSNLIEDKESVTSGTNIPPSLGQIGDDKSTNYQIENDAAPTKVEDDSGDYCTSTLAGPNNKQNNDSIADSKNKETLSQNSISPLIIADNSLQKSKHFKNERKSFNGLPEPYVDLTKSCFIKDLRIVLSDFSKEGITRRRKSLRMRKAKSLSSISTYSSDTNSFRTTKSRNIDTSSNENQNSISVDSGFGEVIKNTEAKQKDNLYIQKDNLFIANKIDNDDQIVSSDNDQTISSNNHQNEIIDDKSSINTENCKSVLNESESCSNKDYFTVPKEENTSIDICQNTEITNFDKYATSKQETNKNNTDSEDNELSKGLNSNTETIEQTNNGQTVEEPSEKHELLTNAPSCICDSDIVNDSFTNQENKMSNDEEPSKEVNSRKKTIDHKTNGQMVKEMPPEKHELLTNDISCVDCVSDLVNDSLIKDPTSEVIPIRNSTDIKPCNIHSKTINEKPPEDPEFLKYIETRIDSLIDEYPHFTEDEMTAYLKKTYAYEKQQKVNIDDEVEIIPSVYSDSKIDINLKADSKKRNRLSKSDSRKSRRKTKTDVSLPIQSTLDKFVDKNNDLAINKHQIINHVDEKSIENSFEKNIAVTSTDFNDSDSKDSIKTRECSKEKSNKYGNFEVIPTSELNLTPKTLSLKLVKRKSLKESKLPSTGTDGEFREKDGNCIQESLSPVSEIKRRVDENVHVVDEIITKDNNDTLDSDTSVVSISSKNNLAQKSCVNKCENISASILETKKTSSIKSKRKLSLKSPKTKASNEEKVTSIPDVSTKHSIDTINPELKPQCNDKMIEISLDNVKNSTDIERSEAISNTDLETQSLPEANADSVSICSSIISYDTEVSDGPKRSLRPRVGKSYSELSTPIIELDTSDSEEFNLKLSQIKEGNLNELKERDLVEKDLDQNNEDPIDDFFVNNENAIKESKYDDHEFMKFVVARQDAIIDENPDFTDDEVLAYLYKAWQYETNNRKVDFQNDEIDTNSLVKGLDDHLPVKKAPKKQKSEKIDKEFLVKESNINNTTKEKTARKRTIKSYFEVDTDDSEFDCLAFEEPPKKKLLLNLENGIDKNLDILEKSEGCINIPPTDIQATENQIITTENENLAPIFDETFYLNQLVLPKPNVFKGYAKERVCEICEMPSDLVKCKGPCNGTYHLECVKNQKESPSNSGDKRRRKKKGKTKKAASSDDSRQESDSFERKNESTNDTLSLVIDQNDFESHLEAKMKELLENSQPNMEIEWQYSPEQDLNWQNTVSGNCEIVDLGLKPKFNSEIEINTFKCLQCEKYPTPLCFVCKKEVSKNGVTLRKKCSQQHCYKYYHLECLEHWPQTQFQSKGSNDVIMTCPRHVCHTCVSDDPRGCKTRFNGDKLARCVRCPAVYHTFTKCLPAGSQILTASHVICPRHYEPRCSKPGRVPFHHVNTSWCFICALGGSLICCEYCPTSFHADCLKIKPPEGSYMCEDCETGRLPLYGEMVWVKLGTYRWWPGVILHPGDIPANILNLKHSLGEFCVRFFGPFDHYWVNSGRVFPYQEGDTGNVSTRQSKIDATFTLAMQQAKRAYNKIKEMKENEEECVDLASSLLPPQYVRLKVNRPHGTLASWRPDLSDEGSMSQCDCAPDAPDPCGPDSRCLNRMLLTECGDKCRAGDRCRNRRFERREYPRLAPYRTPHRGWGLKTLEDIKKGEFVIEYVGELIDEQEFRKRMARKHEIRDENYYFLTLDKDRMIDAGPKGNMARFMNHSCEPNCETQKWTVLGDVRVGLFAIHDIPANTEVTFNYQLESAGIERKPCLCGAARCSGYMGAKPKQDVKVKTKSLMKIKDKHKVKDKLVAKRKYTKRNKDEKLSPKKRGRPRKTLTPPKPKELTEIEKDLMIIQNATNGISSDSELDRDKILRTSVDTCEVDSNASKSSIKSELNPLKRKRVSFSSEEIYLYNSEAPCMKKMRLIDGEAVDVTSEDQIDKTVDLDSKLVASSGEMENHVKSPNDSDNLKKRGRPRKNPVELNFAKKLNASGKIERRGRPRKHPKKNAIGANPSEISANSDLNTSTEIENSTLNTSNETVTDLDSSFESANSDEACNWSINEQVSEDSKGLTNGFDDGENPENDTSIQEDDPEDKEKGIKKKPKKILAKISKSKTLDSVNSDNKLDVDKDSNQKDHSDIDSLNSINGFCEETDDFDSKTTNKPSVVNPESSES